MEFRKLKVTFTNVGKGQHGTRISLPNKWTKEMGVTQEAKEVVMTQISTALVITKQEISEEDSIKLEKILKKYT